jgi:hypothetical protein
VTLLPYRRAVALLVLGGLSFWNAPAMALPALIQAVPSCQSAHTTVPSAMAHQHHGSYTLPAQLTVAAPAMQRVAADCVVAHSCCSFNREPARTSNPFSIKLAHTETAGIAPSPSTSAGGGTFRTRVSLPHLRPVLETKADLRI